MIIFQYGAELYPTEARGVGIAFSSFLGSTGLTVIPFINYLGTQWLVLPIVIMGVMCIVGGLLTLRLPETLDAKLPQTIEEGEEFGKDFVGWKSLFSLVYPWYKNLHFFQTISRLFYDLTRLYMFPDSNTRPHVEEDDADTVSKTQSDVIDLKLSRDTIIASSEELFRC